jgi:NADP-dependent alcohol dehydrogenase
MKAVAVIKEQKIDFILAVGGGSVIDGEIHFSSRTFEGNQWKFFKEIID